MSSFWVFVLLIVNFGISWFNAYSVGRSWADSKAVGGWPRFIIWCAAVMSACGFTWCYLIVLTFMAGAAGYLSPRYMQLALEIGYVIIIFPILGSGFGIWMDCLTTAYRRRDFASIATAGWNTYAQIHNTYQAASMLPDIFKDIMKGLSEGDSDDAKGKLVILALLLVLVALCGGVFTTIAIVKRTARNYSTGVIHQANSAYQRARSY
jgi:hypothetical protein